MSAPPLPIGSGNSSALTDGIIRADAPHHAERVVRAAVEHDDQLELALVMLLEVAGIVPQHRFDAALFVVSRDQEQQAVLGHADYLPESGQKATELWPA